MELKYTYEQDGQWLFGWFLDYPEHPTQGVDVKDLEEHLTEIYGWIKDGTLEIEEHPVLRIAG